MTNPNYELRFFEDKISSGDLTLPPALRVLYVVSGAVAVDGNELATGDGVLLQGQSDLKAIAATVLARWEVAPIGAPLDNPVSQIGDSLLKRSDNIFIGSDGAPQKSASASIP